MIPLKGFAPDVDPHIPGVITECSNMMPVAEGFRTSPSPVGIGYSALSSACKGAALLKQLDGTTRLVAGENDALWSAASGSWTDRTRTSGGAYSVGTSDRWRFAQFGNVSIAAAKSDTLQYWSTGTDFENITGAPKADLVCTVAGFVMLANTNDGTYGDQADRWWCSAIYDHTDWTPAISTQCTTGRLVDTPGRITALKPLGDKVIAYKENAIYVGSYVGAPLVWSWSLVTNDIGAPTHESVIDAGSFHLFIGNNDEIYVFDGSYPIPIGNEIKDWFFLDLDKTYAYRIDGIHDKERSNVIWFYPSDGSGSVLDSALIYNYKYKRWGHASYNIEVAVNVVGDGVTYESIGTLYSTYDDLPEIAMDSPYWQASSEVLGVFDTTHTIKTMTGVGGTMTLTTGYLGDDQLYTLARRVRPRFSDAPATGTLNTYYRNESGEADTIDKTVTMSNGKFDFLRSARWHKLKFTFTGDCEISGFAADIRPSGSE